MFPVVGPVGSTSMICSGDISGVMSRNGIAPGSVSFRFGHRLPGQDENISIRQRLDVVMLNTAVGTVLKVPDERTVPSDLLNPPSGATPNSDSVILRAE